MPCYIGQNTAGNASALSEVSKSRLALERTTHNPEHYLEKITGCSAD